MIILIQENSTQYIMKENVRSISHDRKDRAVTVYFTDGVRWDYNYVKEIKFNND